VRGKVHPYHSREGTKEKAGKEFSSGLFFSTCLFHQVLFHLLELVLFALKETPAYVFLRSPKVYFHLLENLTVNIKAANKV
jgi:hypothetical protein